MQSKGQGLSPSTPSCGGTLGWRTSLKAFLLLGRWHSQCQKCDSTAGRVENLCKRVMLIPLCYMAEFSQWLLGQLTPHRHGAAAGALKASTAPLRHRKLSNRITKGLLITRELGGGKLIPRINRIIALCLFPGLCLSHCTEFIPP